MAISTPTHLANINDNTSGQTTWATGAITFPAGSLGILLIATSGLTASMASATVSDGTNTWSKVANVDNSGGSNVQAVSIFYFYYAAQATGVTVTATFGNCNERFGWCGYVTGTTATPFDVAATGTGGAAATSCSATTANRAANDEIAFVVMTAAGNATGPTTWPTTGFTATPTLSNPTDGTRSRIGAFEYQIYSGGSGSGAATGTISYASADGSSCGIATFKPAAATGIAVDATSSSGYEAALSSYSWSHTCTGSNLVLLVGVSTFAAGTVTGITYNSVALTRIDARANGVYRSELWYLVAPATGAHTIAVTLSASLTSIGSAVSYTGVNQTTPVVNYSDATGTGNPASASVTTPTDNDWVVDLISTSDTAITVGAGQTSRANNTGALGSGAMSDKGPVTPAASTSMQWTGVGSLDTWAYILAAIEPTADALVYDEPAVDATVQICANDSADGIVETYTQGALVSSFPPFFLS